MDLTASEEDLRRRVFQAVEALVELHKEGEKKRRKASLWNESENVYLVVSVDGVLEYQMKPVLIPLQHPCRTKDVAFISRKNKHDARALFEKLGVTGISQIISFARLRRKYKQFEDQRKLLNKYDRFLCDSAVFSAVCPFLGGKFEKRKKLPLPVRLRGKNVKGKVDVALNSAAFYFRGGSSSSLCIGSLEMPVSHISDNVIKVLGSLPKITGKTECEVFSACIKLKSSPALPVYIR